MDIMNVLTIFVFATLLAIFLYYQYCKFKVAYPMHLKDFIKNEMPPILSPVIKRIRKAIIVFFIFFTILNTTIFTPIVLNELKGDRYPTARAFTTSAFWINQIYIPII